MNILLNKYKAYESFKFFQYLYCIYLPNNTFLNEMYNGTTYFISI